MVDASLTALLQQRSSGYPDTTAYTFIDYEIDPNGFAERLTWAQLYCASSAVADELRACGAPGDRAAILAPQGLEYIIAFLGAIQAGFVAVPLSVPFMGVHDERVSSVLEDCAPSVVLTTSAAVSSVAPYVRAQAGRRAPVVIEVDSLDLATPRRIVAAPPPASKIAYLQYTSGSTRTPAGVIVTHKNVVVNVEQALFDFFGPDTPQDTVFVSWLPFYHDMGLIKGIAGPLVGGLSAVLTSPISFLQRPARWIQMLAKNHGSLTGAPNFAFELAARRTTDEDMAGLDLGHVRGVHSGAERVHAATLRRFTERFARYNLKESVIRPSYGLAEATLYVATSDRGRTPTIARFDYEKLSSGYARPCETEAVGSTELIGHGVNRCTTLRIVDPETGAENPAGNVGEIWVHGENVAKGYWQKPEASRHTFGGRIDSPSAGTAEGPWLRTGDLGVISDGELYIIGRIKDLLIVDGSNHYPDDIEATIQELSRGRTAAISIPTDQSEKLVTIVEVKVRDESAADLAERLRAQKREIVSAISNVHRLRVADLVFVAAGSIPITTSGKVRRSSCVELYRQDGFERVDVTA